MIFVYICVGRLKMKMVNDMKMGVVRKVASKRKIVFVCVVGTFSGLDG